MPRVMRPTIEIRGGQPNDANLLAVLATQVWLHTYATDGITSEIAQYVLSQLTPERYFALLQDPASHVFVAQHEEHLVGFAVIKLGAQCPTGGGSAAELQTLYVQEHFARQGVGKALLQAAEAKAREQSGRALWLTVNAKNSRAIAFYTRQGYSMAGTAYFVLGDSRHENHVLIGRDA
jgi:ribosomal protein S18 acetylase RimI-like enzyme